MLIAYRMIFAILTSLGIIWTIVESTSYFFDSLNVSFFTFSFLVLLVAVSFFVVDGLLFSGFLTKKLVLDSQGFDTELRVERIDVFSAEGCIIIGVNDFFDHIVDDQIVSKRSLHGQYINKFFSGRSQEWSRMIVSDLLDEGKEGVEEQKSSGNSVRYPLGSSASINNGRNTFIFVALTETDFDNGQTKTDSAKLISSLRSALQLARIRCSGRDLFIPLLGSGLGRVGFDTATIVTLLLVAVREEMRLGKITDRITIALPPNASFRLDGEITKIKQSLR